MTVKNLDNIDFLSELFTSVLMPFKSFMPLIVTFAAFDKAAAEFSNEGCSDILCVFIVVLTSLSNSR